MEEMEEIYPYFLKSSFPEMTRISGLGGLDEEFVK